MITGKFYIFFKSEKDLNIFVGEVATVEKAGVSESDLNLNSGPVTYCNCR